MELRSSGTRFASNSMDGSLAIDSIELSAGKEGSCLSLGNGLAFAAAVAILALCGCRHVAVRTYHFDNLRTGWNQSERRLTYANVNPSSIVALSVPLDDQVDTQPLVEPRVRITKGPHRGKHDVVYVTTEGNTVYAIDASGGEILLQANLGPPVPMLSNANVPAYFCTNNGPNIGINGTPVIEPATRTMYVVVYTFEDGTPIYRIHALDLSSLIDKVPPRLITASHTLSDGTTFSFQAGYQRQRPGLLLANGNVYAAFGSFCDWGDFNSRGWILGWKAGSLTPLPSNQLNNTRATAPPNTDNRFLSSVWMSGYGLAADPAGNIYFATGNSDDFVSTYDGKTNIPESVVRLNPDLTITSTPNAAPDPSLFTPSDVATLDLYDTDLGSGGVLLLPQQPSNQANLAVAAGKDGRMFLLNREALGGFTPGGPDKVLDYPPPNIGGCWCGESYFNDGSPHIVSSGGNQIIEWDLQTPQVRLIKNATSAPLPTGSDPGFFTSVSSWGRSNTFIWAVARPDVNDPNKIVRLFAFKARPSGGSLPQPSFKAPAGTWPYYSPNSQLQWNANANIVPVVANGKIYVASYKQLMIFGHNLPKGKKSSELQNSPAEKLQLTLNPGQQILYGAIRSLMPFRIVLRTSEEKDIEVDTTAAIESRRTIALGVGRDVVVLGKYDANGVLHADSIQRAKGELARLSAASHRR